MQKDTSIRRKLYSLASIIGTTYIIFHIILFIFATDIKTKWDVYNQDIQEKNIIISKIMSGFGYNGMIHHYKNYVITQDHDHLEAFNQSYQNFLTHKKDYLSLKNVTKLESQQLKQLEQTIEAYKKI